MYQLFDRRLLALNCLLHTLCWSRPWSLARNRRLLPGGWGAALADLEILVKLGLGRPIRQGQNCTKKRTIAAPLRGC